MVAILGMVSAYLIFGWPQTLAFTAVAAVGALLGAVRWRDPPDRGRRLASAANAIAASTDESEVWATLSREARQILRCDSVETAVGADVWPERLDSIVATLAAAGGAPIGRVRASGGALVRDRWALEFLASLSALAIERHRLAARGGDEARQRHAFVATLAHELRNPLAPLRNGIELMRLTPGLGPDLEAIRRMIDRNVEQLVRLIDDLLDVSRIARGKIQPQWSLFAFADALAEAIEWARPQFAGDRPRLVVRMPSAPIYMRADRTRLIQIVENLLENAAKFTPPEGRVWLDAEQLEPDIEIRVRDTGIGIASERAQHLFDDYAPGERSPQGPGDGLGVGLILVRRLVELHEGTLQVRSAGVGQGAEFIVRLPIVASGSTAESGPGKVSPAAVDATPGAATTRARVLVVDDSSDAVETMAKLLRLSGHQVRTAFDGEDAVVAAAEFHPDVVLLDIGLPRIDGYEACRRIRRDTLGEPPVMIAVTGWGQEADRRRSREVGFDHHLTKPVDFSEIERLMAPRETAHPR